MSGFNQPGLTWRELERRLSGRPGPAASAEAFQPWPEDVVRGRTGAVSYAELHCHSNFSFLDGASHPEELVAEAARLGIETLAITDHDGFYGVVRFAEAAKACGVKTVFGAELSLDLDQPQNGVADPRGTHLLVLAQSPKGYAALSRAMGEAHLSGGEKGRPVYEIGRLTELACDWVILTGCRKGSVPQALEQGAAAGRRALHELCDRFGRDNVFVELWDHLQPLDSERNDALASLAAQAKVGLVATNNVHYATPSGRTLATALAAVRARRSLDEIDGWLPASGASHLRSGDEQSRIFRRFPGAVAGAAELGRRCAFDLALIAPSLPRWDVPEGHTEMSWLRELTYRGALDRYGPRESETVPGAYSQIEHELELIGTLGFPGYFLIVHDIVDFCKRNNIYCQGRGSAANSAVCYALGITNADAVKLGLLFERFMSPARDGPPDIDIDIESGRREEVIQYVYSKYGRHHTAQVANVIGYRSRSAVRDMAKALGFSPGQQDAWSKQIDCRAGVIDADIPKPVVELAERVRDFPRHLGIHSGGMVICDRPVIEVVPVEWGRMPNRSVLQWDKDDCAATGLVKFDLLGLGMLEALHESVDMVRDRYGVELDIAKLAQDDAVYEMLCRADTVGVFQVESRAQMATLPRLRPRCFYDLVVEVALIRPGPIQGGSVHPYIRRRNGHESVTYLHSLLEPALRKTLGIPLFQEQLMQIAIDVAGLTAGEADQLRQAMGSKRSVARMERLKSRLYEGMAGKGVTGEVADQIWDKLVAFANYGFPESHSVSFAYLVYASAYIKHHYPAAFLAGLLNAQPMGFWSPQSLVADARRHKVVVRGPDVNASGWKATLEDDLSVRVGISYVRTIGAGLAKTIAAGRPYESMEDVVRRCGLTQPQVEALATAGAFGCFGHLRREALWAAGAVSQARSGRLEGIVTGARAPKLTDMSGAEEAAADLWALSLSPKWSPTQFVRGELGRIGVVTARGLRNAKPGRVVIAGVVTHRQRPSTASGTTFMNIEDETGLVNVICSPDVWKRHRKVAQSSAALIVWGRLERAEGVVNVIAQRFAPLALAAPVRSRDFR